LSASDQTEGESVYSREERTALRLAMALTGSPRDGIAADLWGETVLVRDPFIDDPGIANAQCGEDQYRREDENSGDGGSDHPVSTNPRSNTRAS
jgi:hypothetical protein